jgi:GNAT superfamily N-acetyltransferase
MPGSIELITIPSTRGEIEIRQSRQEDMAKFRQLRLKALHDHPEAFSADYQAHLEGGDAIWKRYLDIDESARLYLAFHGSDLIGMTSVRLGGSPKIRHNAEILGVYLLPEWRGLGIANALINACCNWARSSGAVVARLGVTAVDQPALRCYERCGFVITGRVSRGILVDGVYYDGLEMSRDLD